MSSTSSSSGTPQIDPLADRDRGFKPRPQPAVNLHKDNFKENGLPKYAAHFRHALDIDRISLATAIWNISSQTLPKTPFDNLGVQYDKWLGAVVGVLSGISNDLLILLIEGRAHELYQPNLPPSLKTPAQHPSGSANPTDNPQPQIYIMTHCDNDGVPPTKQEMGDAIIHMRDYITTTAATLADRKALNDQAHDIDFNSPSGRDWSIGTRTVTAREAWQLDRNGVKFAYPRRYARNPNQRKVIAEWCNAMEKRLEAIDNATLNDPLPWSVCYTGWTKREERAAEHYNHGGAANPIKYLLEAVMANVVAPNESYLMRGTAITPVLTWVIAGLAEHVVSMLTSSYWLWGGLNGSMAGAGGMVTKAEQAGDLAWLNATRQPITQGVFVPGVQSLEQMVEMKTFLNLYEKEGSELMKYKKDVEALESVRGQVLEAANKTAEALKEYATARIEQITELRTAVELRKKRETMKQILAALEGVDTEKR